MKYYRFTFPTYEGGVPSTEVGKGETGFDAFERAGYHPMAFRRIYCNEISQEEYEGEKK